MGYNLLIQTTRNPQAVPNHIHESWNIMFSGKRLVYDDKDCERFLNTHFGKKYVLKFREFKSSCFKADLFRYAWLYEYGGIYCDIKTTFLKNTQDLFPDDNVMYIMFTKGERRIFNGIIATPAKNPVMLKLLNGVMRYIEDENYCHICHDGYKTLVDIYNDSTNDDLDIKIGKHSSPDCSSYPDMHVYYELMHYPSEGPRDRYGMLNYIYDENDEKVIHVRCPFYGSTWGP